MDVAELLIESYGRVPDLVRSAVEGLSAEDLARPPAEGANTIGWLTWHLIRVQDHHVSELLDEEQVWVGGDVAGRFGLAPDPDDTGYGHSAGEVRAVRPDGPDAVLAYLDAVWDRTRAYLAGLTADDLDDVVDERWDPPVTRGVRLVSVVDDCTQHAGQAAYARGLLGL
ncbi:MAG TPA: DUF664 domain-containing protein [Iamia sp.]|nr:DUF664 domain-containing protein [Iamia sp.]